MTLSIQETPSRRAALMGMAAAGATLAAGGAGALAWRRFDLGSRFFNPFSAAKFDLPPVPGLADASGAQILGFSSAEIAGKPVLLNAFASWCPNCRDEHQALLDFARSGEIIYGIASVDDPANTVSYLREFGNPYARVGFDRKGWLYRALGARGIPASFVLAGGQTRFKHVGAMTLPEFQRQIPAALRASL